MVAISAFFDCFVDKELEEKITGKGLIIRLWCWASFEKEDGWTLPYPALIDTGAHTSIIPKRIWSTLPVNKLAEHYTKGLVPNPECKLDVGVGEINIILLDSNTKTKKYRVLSFLAPTDDIPLIIGFKNLLSEFKVCFDYKENKAWIEEK
jgi:predicted aspartyl protease